MNASKIAAVGARRIEMRIRERREAGRQRDDAIRALKHEVTTLTLRCLTLGSELAKAEARAVSLTEVNARLREYLASLEDQQ